MASSPERTPHYLPRLPACHSCSQKKIKCDSGRPSCAHCIRNGSQCSNYDSISDRLVPRALIQELENSQRRIHGRQHQSVGTGASDDAPVLTPATIRNDAPTTQSIASSSTVMNGGGLSFLSLLFSDADWRKSNADLPRELAKTAEPPEITIQPCSLPSRQMTEHLFGEYLGWSHVMNAFLLRREVWELHSRVFSAIEEGQSAAPEDLFRTFVICAIGSVMPFCNGKHSQHPEGYYHAALRHLDSRFLARGLRSVEDLLLICRFGIYHNIGTSIWDLIRLAGRLCIELEIHAHDGGPLHTPIERQHRRRIFWYFYLIDRYSSTTLDRPFTIDDCDIHINLPAEADDDEIESWEGSSSSQLLDSPPGPREPGRLTETSIFLMSVRLRRVSSHIHTEFCRLREVYQAPSQLHLGIGHIHVVVNQLLDELAVWRREAPVIQSPTCLYHSQQWYDLLYAREKLYLVRRAVDLVPKKGGALPRHFLMLLLHGALEVIEKYSALFWTTSLITHTRSYFHMMFTAGLSVIFCVLYCPGLSQGDLQEAARGLRSCERTLASMARRLHDALAYVTVFSALHRDVSGKIGRALGDGSSVRPAASAPSMARPDAEVPFTTSSQAASHHHHPSAPEIPGMAHLTYDRVAEREYAPPVLNTFGSYGRESYSQPLPQPVDDVGAVIPPTPGFATDISPVASQNELYTGGDLLQRTFTDDVSLWNMDTVLWEYVYGDSQTALFTASNNPPVGF
ncbi:related to PPR1 - transcription factor regulating pyrimidine pathway [Cephalotrichum gorgonifer]|uniref:Related to PPR1 - transcription factor regulating pyrimidine pathway n=1 Tax=Cephalotrichum gorgonifer TaxID=2041049 RepID=A0AAE8N178_9PEZI|nr:related to PPR1 - transcription factor regulating pyrimidine pathway [Cephalotrichum gorgonifer]